MNIDQEFKDYWLNKYNEELDDMISNLVVCTVEDLLEDLQSALAIGKKLSRKDALAEAAQTADFVIGTAQDAAKAIRQRIEDISK